MKRTDRIDVTRVKYLLNDRLYRATIPELIEYLKEIEQEIPEGAELEIEDCISNDVDIWFEWKTPETDEEYNKRQELDKIRYSEEAYQRALWNLKVQFGRDEE